MCSYDISNCVSFKCPLFWFQTLENLGIIVQNVHISFNISFYFSYAPFFCCFNTRGQDDLYHFSPKLYSWPYCYIWNRIKLYSTFMNTEKDFPISLLSTAAHVWWKVVKRLDRFLIFVVINDLPFSIWVEFSFVGEDEWFWFW